MEARPSNDLIPVEDQNYWIRIVGADGCFNVEEGQQNELLGIIRYNSGSTKRPTTTGYQFSKECTDEPYQSLVAIVPRTVTTGPRPANNSELGILVSANESLTLIPNSQPRQRRQLRSWPRSPISALHRSPRQLQPVGHPRHAYVARIRRSNHQPRPRPRMEPR